MFSTQTLARRLLYTMFPWYLLLALGMTGAQLAVQYVSVTRDIANDLTALGRTVEPGAAEAVWNLDTPRVASIARGIRQNTIVTGVRIESTMGDIMTVDGEMPDELANRDHLFPGMQREEIAPLHYRSPNGKERLIGYLHMYSSAEVVWNRIRVGFAVALLNSIVFTTGLWLLFSWTIRYRLSDTVTQVAKAVSGWRFQKEHGSAPVEQIVYPYHDELGNLVHALNESRSRLSDSMRELSELNRNLESTVTQRTQELRLAKDAAEAASRAKGTFLANMSHEIRTPMNAIMGLTHLVLETSLSEKQRDYLQKVQTSSSALLGLLNDILDYSKIEAGRLDLERTEFQVEHCLKNVSDLFSGRIEEKGLELFVELDPDVPRWVVGDPLRFEQVLNNLVGNAIKFTESGEIHVKVSLAERCDGDAILQVTVRDTGIGMTQGQAERLFQAFTQGDTSITRKFGGSGLGLAICQHLVRLMDGDINVTSEPGRGSTFTFRIRCGIAPDHPSAGGLQQLRKMKSLVVDDHETSRVMLRRMLESWQFEVTTAATGEDALRAVYDAEAASAPFELLILDWKMPGLSGVDVAKAVAQAAREGRIRRTPILTMVTAHDKDQLLHEAENVSLDSVLTKPVVPSALFNALLNIQDPDRPRAAHQTVHPLAPRETLAPLRGAHILLVEDNALNQEVASEFLGNAGLVVTLASNGEEALECVRKNTFDAVLMDLHMPVMDGLEATRRIREMESGRHLPIIAMSAAAMAQDRAASMEAGMNAHIAKPVDPQELADRLREWIQPKTVVLSNQENAPRREEDIAPLERSLEGVSVRQAMSRLHDNAALYRRLLHSFATRHAGTPQTLRQHAAAGEHDALYRIAHELKSDAGNLGLEATYRAAHELGVCIREQRFAEASARAGALADACGAAVGKLQAIEAEARQAGIADEGGNRDVPASQLVPLLERLAAQLESRNFGAMQTLGEIDAMLADTRLANDFREVSRPVQELRYDQALSALRQFMATCG